MEFFRASSERLRRVIVPAAAVLLVLAFSPSTARAVVLPGPMSDAINARLTVVGIISESTKQSTRGVVVLRDSANNRSFALETGQPLPQNARFKLQSVARTAVVVGDGTVEVTINWAESSGNTEDVAVDSTETALSKLGTGELLSADYWERVYREIASAGAANASSLLLERARTSRQAGGELQAAGAPGDPRSNGMQPVAPGMVDSGLESSGVVVPQREAGGVTWIDFADSDLEAEAVEFDWSALDDRDPATDEMLDRTDASSAGRDVRIID